MRTDGWATDIFTDRGSYITAQGYSYTENECLRTLFNFFPYDGSCIQGFSLTFSTPKDRSKNSGVLLILPSYIPIEAEGSSEKTLLESFDGKRKSLTVKDNVEAWCVRHLIEERIEVMSAAHFLWVEEKMKEEGIGERDLKNVQYEEGVQDKV